MDSCLFCQIKDKKVEASIVYEDKFVTAFLDLWPANPGHVLIVPNKHFSNYSDIESDYLIAMALASQKILKAIEKSDIDCHGANFFLSDGELAGQEVMHSHMHITPRFKEDGHRMGFVDTLNSKKADRMKLNEIAAIISSNIVSMAHE